MSRPEKPSDLSKKFQDLESGKLADKPSAVDSTFGKKDYYSAKEEAAQLGKTGLYKKSQTNFEVPSVLKENPAVIVILLLAIAGISYFVFFPANPVSTKLDLLVFSGEAKLANAQVVVYDGSQVIASGTTDANGKATFQGLPAKPLRFTITTSSGTIERTINPGNRHTFSFNVAGQVAEQDSITLAILDETNSQPISGIKISYALGSNSSRSFVETGENGRATIELSGETILRMRIVDPLQRFEATSLTLLANKDNQPILLKHKTQSNNNSTVEPAKITTVTILLRDSQGVVNGGLVSAFYTFTGAKAGRDADVVNGEATISDLPVGSPVSFSVQSPGYYPTSSPAFTITDPMQPVLIALEKVPPGALKTKISLTSNGQSINGAVHILEKGNLTELVSTTSLNGTAQFSLPDSTYYALIIASGYLPFTTSEFTNGDDLTAELALADDQNSAQLDVSIVDEDNAPVTGATVSVVNPDGLLLDLPQQTELGTNAIFKLPINTNVEIRASLEPSHATQLVELVQNTAINMSLLSHAAYVDLVVKNLQDNSLVQATLTSYYQGSAYRTCTGNGGCIVPVRGNNEVAVTIDAPGYLPYTYYSESINEKATKQDVVHLIPTTAAEQIKVDLLEIIDSQGNTVSGNVLRSGKYTAKFSLSAREADQLSIYVRVGDGKQNASLSSIYLLEPISIDSVDVAKSNIYLGPRPQCEDLSNPALEPPYKWAELTFTNTSSQEVNIPFQIPNNIRENVSFSLEYRAKVIAGNLNARDPVDNVLRFDASSPQKANCYADTKKVEFTVASQRTPVIENIFPAIEGNFTAGDALVYDPIQKSIRSQNGLNSFDLQVDSILPGDAMPLTIQSDSQCVLVAQQPNTTSNDPTASCYQFDSTKKLLTFQTHELNPFCPIYLKDDKFYSATGTRVTKHSATLTVLATCSPEAILQIPINVNFVSTQSSLAVRPESDQLGEGDASKLIYIINNRQLQRRNIDTVFQTTTATTNSYQLVGPTAKAIAWRGPGDLEFTENGELVDQLSFENQAGDIFKPGIGILSHRQTSCAANDVFCCANGWCTRKAVEEFVPSFKETALRVAKSTAFRRGNGQPLAALSGGSFGGLSGSLSGSSSASSKPFKFVTAVQIAQGGQQALTVQGINFTAPLACTAGNPGVYELSISSATGNEDDWNYSAHVLDLKPTDYIQRPNQCGSGTLTTNATQSSLTSATGEVTLCNFLYAKNNCIESTKNALITSIDQVETLQFQLTNCMYPVFPGAPVCPGTKMILPAINLGNYRATADFNSSDSPNAFQKLWSSISDANASKFSIFTWKGQLKCVIPPSFQQFAISAAAAGLDISDKENKGEKDAVNNRAPAPITSNVCSRQDFFNLGVVPNLESIIPLAGVCCPSGVNAEICTPRKGKFFISVKDNSVQIVTQWGLTESCYPYWPFPTDLEGLLQKQNVVSVAFGLGEYITSNGANFEMSLSSETPGEKPVATTGLSSVPCTNDEQCKGDYQQCSVNKIYQYAGGHCVGQSASAPGVCSFASTSDGQTCTGGTQCKQDGKTATCAECGSAGQACCIASSNAFCKPDAGCIITGAVASCVSRSECGGENQPVCGGWQSAPTCNSASLRIQPPDGTRLYSICVKT